MPHDAKGNLIQPGDKVVIPATVLNVYQTDGNLYCNCDVEFDYLMPPNMSKERYSALNTKQVIKVNITPGQIAYEAYRKHAGGVSLATGAQIPEWGGLKDSIRDAWEVAAAAAIGSTTTAAEKAS